MITRKRISIISFMAGLALVLTFAGSESTMVQAQSTTTIVVNNYQDSLTGNCALGNQGTCNLRAAIAMSQVQNQVVQITFNGPKSQCGTNPVCDFIQVSLGPIEILNQQTVRLIGGVFTIIDGGDVSQLFKVYGGCTLDLQYLNFTEGESRFRWRYTNYASR